MSRKIRTCGICGLVKHIKGCCDLSAIRDAPIPIKIGSPEFKKLQRHWYGKLKASGFEDIENGHDYNEMHVSTISGKAPEQTSFHKDAPNVSDTETAQYWRLVGQVAAAMDKHPLYPIIRAYADTGSIEATAKANGMLWKVVQLRLERLLTPLGLWR